MFCDRIWCVHVSAFPINLGENSDQLFTRRRRGVVIMPRIAASRRRAGFESRALAVCIYFSKVE